MIPPILHHYWTSGDEINPLFIGYINSFKRHNPAWKFNMWTPDNAPYDKMSPEATRIIQSKSHYVLKSDVLRWEILRIFGGVVSDTDIQCLKSLYPLLDTDSFCGRSWGDNDYGNSFVGAVAGHSVIERLSATLCKKVLDNWELCNSPLVWKVTVIEASRTLASCTTIHPRIAFYPFSWDDVLMDSPACHELCYPKSYCIHWWYGISSKGWTADMAGRKGDEVPKP